MSQFRKIPNKQVNNPAQIAILPRHSPIEVLRARLKELKAPIWGTKAQMHDRLMLVEAKKAAEDRTRAELEAKHVKLAEGTTDRMAAVLPAPEMPSPSEVANHNLTHLPRAKWCITCQLGGSNDGPHRLIPFVNKEKARLQWDFMHMKSHDSQCEWLLDEPPSNEWNVILTAIDEDSGCKLAVVLPDKTVENTYGCECVVDFIRRLGHRDCTVLRDGEPALVALINNAVTECGKIGIVAEPRDAPRYSHAGLGAVGRAHQTIKNKLEVWEQMSKTDIAFGSQRIGPPSRG